jgi:hypothetical protein
MNIPAVLNSLALKRPIFHNEADFQHALAWEIREKYDCTIRLERRMDIDSKKRSYLDIFVEHEGRRTAIELKYKMRATEIIFQGETFSLLNQGAQDIGRYDVLKDLQRLEQMVNNNLVDEGYLVFLTNDASYYRDPVTEKQTADRDFRIHDGKFISGTLTWSESTGEGTMKGREEPLIIEDSYQVSWNEYSRLDASSSGIIMGLTFHVGSKQNVNRRIVEEARSETVVEERSIDVNPAWFSVSNKEFCSLVQSIDAIPVSQVDLRDKLVARLLAEGYKIQTNRDLGVDKVDILAVMGEEEIAIEVRYKTALLQTIYNGTTIDLKNQAAQDISRYDFLKDLEKLEKVTSHRPGTKGYAILITNDHSYWNPSTRSSSVDEDFRLHHGRKVHGKLSWKHASSGTTQNREEPIVIRDEYTLVWNPFLTVEAKKNERFQILIVEVEHSS